MITAICSVPRAVKLINVSVGCWLDLSSVYHSEYLQLFVARTKPPYSPPFATPLTEPLCQLTKLLLDNIWSWEGSFWPALCLIFQAELPSRSKPVSGAKGRESDTFVNLFLHFTTLHINESLLPGGPDWPGGQWTQFYTNQMSPQTSQLQTTRCHWALCLLHLGHSYPVFPSLSCWDWDLLEPPSLQPLNVNQGKKKEFCIFDVFRLLTGLSRIISAPSGLYYHLNCTHGESEISDQAKLSSAWRAAEDHQALGRWNNKEK